MRSVQHKNFGHNLVLQPTAICTPANEQEVLEILDQNRGQQIHAIGKLHSWSEAIVANNVLLDLRQLNDVQLQQDGDHLVATVGAGCQINRLLAKLDHQGATLHSLGLITEQTIAGAISTGTHGSGNYSMSHFVEAVRLARYDNASGKAIIEDVNDGEQLQAARCSLGSLGIILAIKIRCRTQYNIQEHFSESTRLSDVLDAEASYPLQQFYLIPWRWSYISQHRREDEQPRSRLARLYRLYWLLVVDFSMHLLVTFLARTVHSRRLMRSAFRHLIPSLVIRNWKVTDRSSSMLVMKHDAFRHIEIELFVRRDQLADGLDYAQEVIKVAGGEKGALPENNQRLIEEIGLQEDLVGLHDQYCHHYPVCVRRVLPDDTLISMSCGTEEDWYALSFISYEKPDRRAGFFLFASFMARSMSRLFQARPHWGKVCPLDANELESLYPKFDSFRSICNTFDSEGVFRNSWTKTLLKEDPRA